jgi:hypothetical protein
MTAMSGFDSGNWKRVYGHDAKLHECTGLPIEQGSGALSKDQQAIVIHLPELFRRKGQDAYDTALLKLAAAGVQLPGHLLERVAFLRQREKLAVLETAAMTRQ